MGVLPVALVAIVLLGVLQTVACFKGQIRLSAPVDMQIRRACLYIDRELISRIYNKELKILRK